tara:strand:+ start:1125 stop:1997 length:873 start_codon:yes stop_codon:yes gene_type:complete
MPIIFKNPALLINLSSGSASDISQEITTMVTDKGHSAPECFISEGEKIAEQFSALKASKPDLIIVFGGDGTCRSAAEIAREYDVPLIALPGGTMNILPRELYKTIEWKEALKLALDQKEPRWHKAGLLNGSPFYCGAIIGAPTRMANVRESVRQGQLSEAVTAIPKVVEAVTEGDTFSYHVDGNPTDLQANAILLSFPSNPENYEGEPEMEMASVMPLSVGELLKVGAQSLLMDWRESENIDSKRIRSLEIDGQGRFETLLDGEAEIVSCPIAVTLEKKGVKVMAPNPKT